MTLITFKTAEEYDETMMKMLINFQNFLILDGALDSDMDADDVEKYARIFLEHNG